MLHTLVRVTVRCDSAGCPAFAERLLANSASPRALLAAVRRSLRRRDGWALSAPLLGRPGDRCPQCAQARARDAGIDLFRKRATALTASTGPGPAVPGPGPAEPAEPAAARTAHLMAEPAAARTAHLMAVPEPGSEATQVMALAGPVWAGRARPVGAAR